MSCCDLYLIKGMLWTKFVRVFFIVSFWFVCFKKLLTIWWIFILILLRFIGANLKTKNVYKEWDKKEREKWVSRVKCEVEIVRFVMDAARESDTYFEDDWLRHMRGGEKKRARTGSADRAGDGKRSERTVWWVRKECARNAPRQNVPMRKRVPIQIVTTNVIYILEGTKMSFQYLCTRREIELMNVSNLQSVGMLMAFKKLDTVQRNFSNAAVTKSDTKYITKWHHLQTQKKLIKIKLTNVKLQSNQIANKKKQTKLKSTNKSICK